MSEPLFSPRVVRALLRDLGVKPNRNLGQNFLIDGNVAQAIVERIAPTPGESILEIGGGLGVLTDFVARRSGHLTVLEKDSRLAGYLRTRFGESAGVEVVEADFFELDLPRFLAERRIGKIYGNLPYCSGSRMLVDLVRLESPPPQLVVTVQSEVADRLSASPGTRDYGLLTVWVGLRYSVQTLRRIRPSCFFPRPEVSSTTLRLVRRPDDRRPPPHFYEWTQAAFQQRRKQLGGLLAKGPHFPGWPEGAIRAALTSAGADSMDRPETLSPDQWRTLVERLEDE